MTDKKLEPQASQDLHGRIRQSVSISLKGVALVMQIEATMGVEGRATRALPHLVAALQVLGASEEEIDRVMRKAGASMTAAKMKALKQVFGDSLS